MHYLQNVRLRDGGVVRAVLDLCTLLASAGHEVTLLCCGEPETPSGWSADTPRSPKVVSLGPPGAAGLLPGRVLAAATPELQKADVVHLHGMWELSNHQLAAACRRLGRPYIFSPHGMLDDWSMSLRPLKKRAVLTLAARRTLERAACVHFAAQGEMEQASKRFRGRCCVLPLVFDRSAFETLPGPGPARTKWTQLAENRPVLLFLSRVVANKGPDIVLRAAARVAQHRPLVVVAGGGEERYLAEMRDLARRAGVEALFTSHVDGAAKLSLLQCADLFVLPTVHENFGFATLEALAAGTPAVTTPGNLLRRELQESGGALIAERTESSVADALSELLADPARRRSMGESGRRWALSRFAPERLIDVYLQMYQGIGQPRPEGAHPTSRCSR